MTKIITSKLDNYFMLYAAVGWSFMILLGTTFNGGFDLTFKYLSIPIAVVMLAFIHVKSRDLPTKAKVRVWLFGCIFYPIIILFTWPYVLT